MLIGYMRVSKADGSQVLDLQRDALVAAGVTARHLYEDQAYGAGGHTIRGNEANNTRCDQGGCTL
jgi:hypothetical protein